MRRILAFHIAASDVLVIASDPIVSQSDWLPWELDHAKKLGKPVVGFWSPRAGGERSPLVDQLADFMVVTGRIDTLLTTIARAVQAQPTTLGPLPEFVLPSAPVIIDVARGAEGSPFYRPTAPPFDAVPPTTQRLPAIMTTPVADVLADIGATASQSASAPVRDTVALPLRQSTRHDAPPTGTTAEAFVGDAPPTRMAAPPSQALSPDRPKPGLWQRVSRMFGRGDMRH